MADRAAMISRKAALERGLARYFTGKPCTSGHVAERYSSNGDCVVCARLKATRWKKTPKGKAYQRQYHQTPKMRDYKRQYDRTEKRLKRRRERRQERVSAADTRPPHD
jgi:hypothetical protein